MKTRPLIGLAACLLCCVPVSAQQAVTPPAITSVTFRYLASPAIDLGRIYTCSVFNASNRSLTITGVQVVNLSSPSSQDITPSLNTCGGVQGTPGNFVLLPGKACSVLVDPPVPSGSPPPTSACRIKHTGPAQSLVGAVSEYLFDAVHPEGGFRYVLTMQETGVLTPTGPLVAP